MTALLRKCLWTSSGAPAWLDNEDVDVICTLLAANAKEVTKKADYPDASTEVRNAAVKIAHHRTALALRILDAHDALIATLVPNQEHGS